MPISPDYCYCEPVEGNYLQDVPIFLQGTGSGSLSPALPAKSAETMGQEQSGLVESPTRGEIGDLNYEASCS